MTQKIVRWILLVLSTCFYVIFKYNGLMMPSNIISIFMGILLFVFPLKEKIYALLFFIYIYIYSVLLFIML